MNDCTDAILAKKGFDFLAKMSIFNNVKSRRESPRNKTILILKSPDKPQRLLFTTGLFSI